MCKSSIRVCILIFFLLLCGSGQAQPSQSENEQQTPAPGSLEAAIAIEDPSERVIALQKFIRTNSIPEQSLAAREAIVASWAQMAEVQLGSNNIENAVVDFRKAISALPENITDRFFETTVIRIPQAISVRGYRNEAIGLARQLEKRFTGEAQRLTALGEFYMTIEAPADAVRVLEAAVKSGEESARARRALGAAYRISLRLDDAIAEYQQAIKIDPNDKRAYYELANLYRAFGALTDAIKLYAKQLEIEPKHSPSLKGMALAYLAQGNEEQALAELNRARSLSGVEGEISQDIYLQTQMAFYYLGQGKMSQARRSADAALAIEPRYAWARIAAAEIDLDEGKFFEAERNLMAAQGYASFPTLLFTLGKLYLAVEDFDGAVEQFAKAFNYSSQKGFTTKLGGIFESQADNLRDLLAREHQAAIFISDPPTSEEEFKIAESLVRFSDTLRAIKSSTTGRPAKGESRAESNARRNQTQRQTAAQLAELEKDAGDFVDAEKTRRAFRALYIAQTLAQSGIGTAISVEYAELALSMAAIATETEGSLRDYPNYDREGRLRVFRGRALDAKGWALFKAGQYPESIGVLTEAARSYGPLPEGKRTLWRLATAKEATGEQREALNFYIAGYEPPASNSSSSSLDVNRSVIEGLYRKLNGSLDGLEDKLRRAAAGSTSGDLEALLATANPNDKSTGDKASSNEPATGTVESSQREKKEPQLKLSIPSSTLPKVSTGRSAADLFTHSIDPAGKKEKSAAVNAPAVPLTDPMFAKKPTEEPGQLNSESSPPPATRTETEPPAITPVELPVIVRERDVSFALSPIVDHRELFSTWENFTIRVEEETPAPPTATRPRLVHTRKRRINAPE